MRNNPNYWDAAHVKLTKLRFTLADNMGTCLTRYDTGVVDFIVDVASFGPVCLERSEAVLAHELQER